MIKKINLNGRAIEYNLERKSVKNINLRIKSDGGVFVSANRFVPTGNIEKILISKSDFILNALEKFKNAEKTPLRQYFTEEEIKTVITNICEKAYPYFGQRGIAYPVIKFRKMISQWGNCRSREGILTFSTNLMYTPPECIEYVVLHEFTHFIEANHSPRFYAELERVCPDWKERRKMLQLLSKSLPALK